MKAIFDGLKSVNWSPSALSTGPLPANEIERCEDTWLTAVIQLDGKVMTSDRVLSSVWVRQHPALGFKNSMRKTLT